ncbi:MAG: hypothetical protein ACU0CA_12635 [Paracoccaceae bacterium]
MRNLNPRQMLRMTKWARKPPSIQRVKMVAAIIVACLLLFGFERLFGWPEWLTVDGTPRGRINS